MSDEKFVYTACPGWGDHEYCAIKTIVKDGKIVRTEKVDYTGPEANEGFICQKGITSGRHPYLPGRLLHPLKRVGERGAGKWQEISWEQALDEIGEKLLAIRDKYGPESLAVWNLPASIPPSLGVQSILATRFIGLWGATDPVHGYGLDNGPIFATYYEMGSTFGYFNFDPRLLLQSKYIIVWGANPMENQQRIARELVLAKEQGAKVVDIGLVFDGTAGKADWFIPVKPGSDAALALSMAHIIIKENLYDAAFMLNHTVAPFLVRSDDGQLLRDAENNYLVWDTVKKAAVSVAPKADELGVASPALNGAYTVNGVACKPAFQMLVEHLASYTPEAQAAITGVSPEVVYQLTHEYMAVKPALVMGALGMRYQNQGESYRALQLVAALSGNIGVRGGGVTCELMPTNNPIIFNDFPIILPFGFEGNKAKNVRQMDFFEQVKSGKPYPIKAFIKASGNPVHNCPNRSRWVEDTFPYMDLIVDYDIWMTDTGEYADYVLPDCTSFERMEIISSACYGHIVLQEPAIEPLGEAKEPAYLFRELSKRVGLGEFFDKTTEEWLEIRLQSPFPMISGITPPLTMERLKKEKMVRANSPEAPYHPFDVLKFPTPSGRIEFYSEQLADMGEALAKYRPALDVGKDVEKHPYQFFTGRQRFFMQSLFTDDPWMVKLSGGQPTARMNPVDAEKESIKDGDVVECFNQRGMVKAIMRLDEAVPPGTVQVWFGWRKRQFEKGTYSELLVPLGGRETIDGLADRWWDSIVTTGKVAPFLAGGESLIAGAWDTIWDCVCDVRKVNGKNGGQK
jgi:anaerobic selenocysteine-containing dehydrogenase